MLTLTLFNSHIDTFLFSTGICCFPQNSGTTGMLSTYGSYFDSMFEVHSGDLQAGVKLLNIVGATSLFSPRASLFLFNEAEINNMLNQTCWTI